MTRARRYFMPLKYDLGELFLRQEELNLSFEKHIRLTYFFMLIIFLIDIKDVLRGRSEMTS